MPGRHAKPHPTHILPTKRTVSAPPATSKAPVYFSSDECFHASSEEKRSMRAGSAATPAARVATAAAAATMSERMRESEKKSEGKQK